MTDPEVQALLSVAATVDWNALGFSPLPTSGSRLVCAGETVRGRRTWQHPDVNGARPYEEVLHIDDVAQDPGVCGKEMTPGVHAVYWGPNGIEEVDRTEIMQLRARLQQPDR